MDRAERERRAYDEDALWERVHRAHVRFRQVSECPNGRRMDSRWRWVVPRFGYSVMAIGKPIEPVRQEAAGGPDARP
jgi:hypothetical protein